MSDLSEHLQSLKQCYVKIGFLCDWLQKDVAKYKSKQVCVLGRVGVASFSYLENFVGLEVILIG